MDAQKKTQVVIVGLEWDVVDLVDSFPDWETVGLIDKQPYVRSTIPYLGSDSDWKMLKKTHPKLQAILAIDFPDVKAKLFHTYQNDLLTVISYHAYVSKRACIGLGTLVQRGVTVMPLVEIGRGCKLNVNATVHHEAIIGSFSTLCPNSQVLGRVVVEEGVYVGAGAIIRQRCYVGAGAKIGAGAVVVADVAPNTTVVGIPAKPI